LNAWDSLASPKASSITVYVGAYTGDGPNDSKGVYAFSLDEATSTLIPLGLAVATPNPSYVLVHPTHKYLYAANEQDDGKISAFKIDATQRGRLTLVNQQSSRGSYPCYLSTNRVGGHIFVANYNDGTVAVLPIDGNDGSLKQYTGFDQQTGSSVDADRQRSSHAHCILLDKIEQNALSADLGSDQIYTYRFFPNNGSLLRINVAKAAKPGDGPRHLILNSNQKFVYVMNELKSTVTVYNYFPALHAVQTISTLPSDFTSYNTGAEILLHPISEKYLYVSNRGHDSIAVFTVDNNTGHLALIQHISVQGRTPRNFNISPDGKYLIVANQDSNNLVLFTIDHTTGKLTSTGSTVQVSKPTCVKYLVE
jgi:6-phosphogluconolactonase